MAAEAGGRWERDGKLRELRFHLERQAVRVTYGSGPRIVLLVRCEAQEHTAEGSGDGGA